MSLIDEMQNKFGENSIWVYEILRYVFAVTSMRYQMLNVVDEPLEALIGTKVECAPYLSHIESNTYI